MKSLIRKAQLARELSLKDWLTLAYAWWVLLVYYLLIRYLSYSRLMKLTHPATQSTFMLENLNVAEHLAWLVKLATRLHLLPMTCLEQAFALHWILSNRGFASKLQIGTQQVPNGIKAHAWVEVSRKAIGEPYTVSERFITLKSTETISS